MTSIHRRFIYKAHSPIDPSDREFEPLSSNTLCYLIGLFFVNPFVQRKIISTACIVPCIQQHASSFHPRRYDFEQPVIFHTASARSILQWQPSTEATSSIQPDGLYYNRKQGPITGNVPSSSNQSTFALLSQKSPHIPAVLPAQIPVFSSYLSNANSTPTSGMANYNFHFTHKLTCFTNLNVPTQSAKCHFYTCPHTLSDHLAISSIMIIAPNVSKLFSNRYPAPFKSLEIHSFKLPQLQIISIKADSNHHSNDWCWLVLTTFSRLHQEKHNKTTNVQMELLRNVLQATPGTPLAVILPVPNLSQHSGNLNIMFSPWTRTLWTFIFLVCMDLHHSFLGQLFQDNLT